MDQNLIYSADIIGMFCRRYMNTKRDLPIRASEMGVLIFTHKQSEPVTPLMISQFFNITKPSVSAMVKSMIQQGYLTKHPSSADKRSYALKLTDKGEQLVNETASVYFNSVEQLREHMGHQQFHQLMDLLQIANDLLEEVR